MLAQKRTKQGQQLDLAQAQIGKPQADVLGKLVEQQNRNTAAHAIAREAAGTEKQEKLSSTESEGLSRHEQVVQTRRQQLLAMVQVQALNELASERKYRTYAKKVEETKMVHAAQARVLLRDVADAHETALKQGAEEKRQ